MVTSTSEVSQLDAIVLGRLSRSETARTLEQANLLFSQGRTAEAQAAVDAHLQELEARRETAKKLSKAKDFFDPFSRNLDDDFAAQDVALDEAAAGFDAAAASPAPPAANVPGKTQVKRNAEAADAFAL